MLEPAKGLRSLPARAVSAAPPTWVSMVLKAGSASFSSMVSIKVFVAASFAANRRLWMSR